MPNADHSQQECAESDSSTLAHLSEREPKAQRSQKAQPTVSQKETSETDKPSPIKTLWREFRIIDAINCIVGIGMLIIAMAAYRVASDTRDVKKAVESIATLAKQTKRHADAAIGQLDEMRAEQRPLIGAPLKISAILKEDESVDFSLIFNNVGRTQTYSFVIDGDIFGFYGNRSPNDASRSICHHWMKEKASRKNLMSAIPGSNWPIYLSATPTGSKTVYTIGWLKTLISPFIAGCAVYTSPNGKQLYHTAFWASLKVAAHSIEIGPAYAVDAK